MEQLSLPLAGSTLRERGHQTSGPRPLTGTAERGRRWHRAASCRSRCASPNFEQHRLQVDGVVTATPHCPFRDIRLCYFKATHQSSSQWKAGRGLVQQVSWMPLEEVGARRPRGCSLDSPLLLRVRGGCPWKSRQWGTVPDHVARGGLAPAWDPLALTRVQPPQKLAPGIDLQKFRFMMF